MCYWYKTSATSVGTGKASDLASEKAAEDGLFVSTSYSVGSFQSATAIPMLSTCR